MGIPDSARRAGVSRVAAGSCGADDPGGVKRHVHAYYCDTRSIDLPQYRALARGLSADEQARADALWRSDDRRDYVAAHALLRRAMAASTGQGPEHLVFERDENGKPFLVQSGTLPASPHFSLSHSHDLVACVISRTCAVGIDVEVVNPAIDVQRLATRYFTADEAAALQRWSAEERPSRFCELWSLKEALLKAVGIGPTTSIDSVSFRVDGGKVSLTLAPPGIATDWTLTLLDVGRSHTLAIAAGGPASRPRVIPVTPLEVLEGSFGHERCNAVTYATRTATPF
jgi:4'-phosphopantetheinyl transferase